VHDPCQSTQARAARSLLADNKETQMSAIGSS
jgi:hypothetical protein